MKDSLLIQPQSGVGSRQSGLEAKRTLSMNKENGLDTYEKDASRFSDKFQNSSKEKPPLKNNDISASDKAKRKTEDGVISENLTLAELSLAAESETQASGDTLTVEASTHDVDTHHFMTIKGTGDGSETPSPEEVVITNLDTSLGENSQNEILIHELTTDIIQLNQTGDSQVNVAQMVQAIAMNGNTDATPDNLETEAAEVSGETIDLLTSSDLRDLDIQAVETDASETQSDLLLRREVLNTSTLINSGFVMEDRQLFPNSAITTGTPLFGLGMESQAPLILQGQTLTGPSTPTAPTLANAITNTVAQAILTAKETPQGVVVQLDPPEMGRVYIDFMFDADNAVTVVVKTDSAESHAILRERSEQFMQMLAESGFENVNLSFEQQNSDQDGQTNETFENGRHLEVMSDQPINDIVTSYENPIYRVNEDQLRLDLKI